MLRFADLPAYAQRAFVHTVEGLNPEFGIPTDPESWAFEPDPGFGYANCGKEGLGPTFVASAQATNDEVGGVSFVYSPKNFHNEGREVVPGVWLWIGEDV